MNKRLKAPINVQVEVTSGCNNECVHCYNFWRFGEQESRRGKTEVLCEKDARTIVHRLGEAEIFHVTITGGEPLLNYPVTLLCIELIKKMHMGVGLNSNMVLLTMNRAKELKKAGLNHILTSILGPNAQIHDNITQRHNSFRKLIEAIEIAHGAGLSVSVNMVVSQLNHDQVRSTAKVVSELGIKSFMATKAGCPGNCTDFSGIASSQEQVITFLNDLCWIKENLGLNVDILEPIPLCGLLGVTRPELFSRRKCSAGVTSMTVSYDGSVRPCSHLDTSYGNMLREDLRVIWARMDTWSQRFQIPEECSSCNLLNMCGSGCRMEAKMDTSKINGLDPVSRLDNRGDVSRILESVCNTATITPNNHFKTPKFRLRQEAFGGVFVAGKTTAFLDVRGFSVLKQLAQETVYDLATIRIDWNGLNPESFVAGLVRRKMVV